MLRIVAPLSTSHPAIFFPVPPAPPPNWGLVAWFGNRISSSACAPIDAESSHAQANIVLTFISGQISIFPMISIAVGGRDVPSTQSTVLEQVFQANLKLRS